MDLSVLVTQPEKNPGVTVHACMDVVKHTAMVVTESTFHPSGLKYQREATPMSLYYKSRKL